MARDGRFGSSLPSQVICNMANKKVSSGKPRASSLKDVTPGTFAGLNINSDGSEPITRNTSPPNGKPSECKQKEARETLKKVERDMTRRVLTGASIALANPSE
jgi:hypothetical protein